MGDLSVLVVDDEVDFVNILLKRLRKKGVVCKGAYSGRDALEKIRGESFEVVLLDMRLTDSDGNDVLRQIKKDRPDTRVVVLSGYASAQAAREVMECGADDYLIKPMEFETLHEKLKDAASRASLSKQRKAV